MTKHWTRMPLTAQAFRIAQRPPPGAAERRTAGVGIVPSCGAANSVTEKYGAGMIVIVIVTVAGTESDGSFPKTGIVTGNVKTKKQKELIVAGMIVNVIATMIVPVSDGIFPKAGIVTENVEAKNHEVTETVTGLGVVRLGNRGARLASPLAQCATTPLEVVRLATAANVGSQKKYVVLVKTMTNTVIDEFLPGSVVSPAGKRVADQGNPAPEMSAEEGAVTKVRVLGVETVASATQGKSALHRTVGQREAFLILLSQVTEGLTPGAQPC